MDILQKLNHNLLRHLKSVIPNHPISEVYEYAVSPPGKLFRPQLVWAINRDFSETDQYNQVDQLEIMPISPAFLKFTMPTR